MVSPSTDVAPRPPGSGTPAPADEQLMRGLVEGRHEAVRTLYARHAPWVFAMAARRLGAAAAEEVVQDTFLGVFRARSSFDPARGSFRAWLREAARRCIANELRRRSRKGGNEDAGVEMDELPSGTPEADEEVFRAFRATTIRRALEQLPEAQRRALCLAFYEDLSHEEVASLLEVPVGTTKTRIRTGLKKLGVVLLPLALLAAVVWIVRGERSERDRTERALRMVTASDSERIRMEAAAGVAPAAHGNYRWRAGTGLAVITLSDMPPLPPGRRYALWAVVNGKTVALGSAEPGPDGKALLAAEDPALSSAPSMLEATLEAPGASAPSGPVVLTWSR